MDRETAGTGLTPPPPPARLWSELPPELVSGIFSRLSIEDRLRCRSVCLPWSSALTLISLFPWLTFSYRDKQKQEMMLRFLPKETSWSAYLGSINGWVILSSLQQFPCFLYNPISDRKIDIPPNWLVPYSLRDDGRIVIMEKSSDFFQLEKIILSSDPINSIGGVCILAAIDGKFRKLALSSLGSGSWYYNKNLKIKAADIIFYQGRIHVITKEERLYAIDFEKTRDGMVIIRSTEEFKIERRPGQEKYKRNYNKYVYLVESCNRNSLVMAVKYEYEHKSPGWKKMSDPARILKLYELDSNASPFKWVEKESLVRMQSVSGFQSSCV